MTATITLSVIAALVTIAVAYVWWPRAKRLKGEKTERSGTRH